jgi:hypothetical protein
MTGAHRRVTMLQVTKIIKGHFDGRVIVPETPVDLPRNQRLTISVEPDESPQDPERGTVGYLVKHLKPMSDEDADEMRRAIAEARKHVEPDPDVNLD